MPRPDEVLAARRGSIVAPAGCGKTELLVRSALAATGLRVLVLTHTRAGVSAVKRRIRAVSPRCTATVMTIDGWARWLVSRFPTGSRIRLDQETVNWAEVRRVAVRLVSDPTTCSLLGKTYGRVLVDEYQDCDRDQHDLVLALARTLPTVVLGDPMQRVFDFRGDFLPWSAVESAFPALGMLGDPWRWEKHGNGAFGRWLLDQRRLLEAGAPVDLRTAPLGSVRFVREPAGRNERALVRRQAIPPPGRSSVLVILDARDRGARNEAARLGLRLAVVEPLNIPDLTAALEMMAGVKGLALAEASLDFAAKVMTSVEAGRRLSRLRSILAGTNRSPPTPAELAAPIRWARAAGLL